MGRIWNLAVRRRILIGGVVGAFFTVAGLGGLPDDIATLWGWLSWLQGDAGRWLFVVFGIGLLGLTFADRIDVATRLRTTKEARIPLKSIRFGTLVGYREHCGVLWRGRIRESVLRVGGPYCPEDENELEYKTGYPSFRFPPPQPLTPTFAPKVLGDLGFTPSQGKEEEEDDDIRDLKEDDTSGKSSGPYCKMCKRLRPIPKRVGDCRWEVLQQIERELIVAA